MNAVREVLGFVVFLYFLVLIGRVVFDVVGSDHIERDRELLEDRASLRARRGEGQTVLRATHRSSDGHFLAQSAVTAE